ncbi:hypothetical protein PRK78_006445 [Emydomyces testavorans]|uniref:Uncharacterized protein n=1 Tax=Emydomyces testavorans TaxID=2070801 RepID=A0AAF0ILN5_9EURO|nr:hypothetical protein PRK78_006445 [Emydomyces testavorans]
MSLFSSTLQAEARGMYNWEEGLSLARESSRAELIQLVAAADHVACVLQGSTISFALMGGFSLWLRGSRRDTHDVDIAVGCNMLQLREVLSAQQRILRPAGPVSGVMRIFVKVGGEHNPGIPELYVMVDLILCGSLGAPVDVHTASELVTATTPLGPRQFPLLNIGSILNSKLGAFFGRREASDYLDIKFITQHFADKALEPKMASEG